MSRYSDQDLKELLCNPHILKVNGSNITYTSDFKIATVEQYLDGKTPKEIFRAAGINLGLFDQDYAKKAVARWRIVYKKYGPEGLRAERRGSGATGRPKGLEYKTPAAEIKALKEEIALLKKLRASVSSKPQRRYSR